MFGFKDKILDQGRLVALSEVNDSIAAYTKGEKSEYLALSTFDNKRKQARDPILFHDIKSGLQPCVS